MIGIVFGVCLLAFLLFYVVPNVIRYPLHSAVFVAAFVLLGLIGGGWGRLRAWLDSSPHPAARRVSAGLSFLSALVEGKPPYDAARWWVPRGVARLVWYAGIFAVVLGVVVALGGIFTWIDGG